MGKGSDQWCEVGVSCNHDGDIKMVCGGQTQTCAGYGNIGFFFFKNGDKGAEVFGPGLPFLETAFMNRDFVRGKSADI